MTNKAGTGPIRFAVVPWGPTNLGELDNAVLSAKAAQDQFRFHFHREPLPLAAHRYRLRDGGLDLDKAARRLTRERRLRDLASTHNAILVTSEPYSAPGATGATTGGRYLPGYFYEADALGDGRVSIVSTYLWDQLPPRHDLPALRPAGRRIWSPYLLLTFAIIALDKLVETEAHPETFACPNDYCDNVIDIDAFFSRGRWFCEQRCNPVLRRWATEGSRREQLKAVKRMLNRARGQAASDGFDSCFIAYGRPDQRFALRLTKGLKARGVECWIYDQDSVPGRRVWASIDSARASADRVLVICSSQSLRREGLKAELESQIREAPGKLIAILRDRGWLDERFVVDRGGLFDLMPWVRDRNYADFVKRPYAQALERLLKALHWT